MVYTRSDGEECYLVALNPTGARRTVAIPSLKGAKSSPKPVMLSGKASCHITPKGTVVAMEPVSAMIVRIR